MRINKLKVLILAFVGMIVFSMSSIALAVNCADCSDQDKLSTQQAIECGTSCASGNNQTPSQATSDVNQTIISVIKVMSLIGGVAAVIMIIVGGFRYVTSAGNPETTKSARNTITYAVIGLAIIAVAQLIVHFVLNQTSSAIK